MNNSFFRAVLVGTALLVCAPALAQQAPEGSVYDGDYLTVGVGGAYGPSYEGSDDYVFFPAAAIQGSIGGIDINPRAGGLALDFIPDGDDAKIGFSLGPVARVRFDRHSNIKDPVVQLLGKRKRAVEVGVNAGVTGYRLLNPYDSLTASVDVRWDVAGAHKGMVVAPTLSYLTPLSKGAAVVLAVSAEHVDNKYADYYYTVTPADSLASGLPSYNAGKGWKNIGVNLLGTYDLDGDLTNGGFALFVGAGYSRELGDVKNSPIVAIRGKASQFVGAIGIGYTF